MQGADFVRDTTVEADPTHAGRYRGELSGDWVVATVPQGGMLVAAAVRAMADALAIEPLGPSRPPLRAPAAPAPPHLLRSVQAVFAGMVAAGPVDIDVTVLRQGRSMSQAMATLRNAGQSAGLTALAVFGASRPGFEFTDVAYPDVAPPESCPSYRDPWPEDAPIPQWDPSPFWQRVEGRAAVGHAPWEVFESHSSETVGYYRFDDPPLASDGSLDPLGLVVLGDTMPGAVGERMGHTGPDWFGPSADLTVHLLGRAHPGWLLARNRARHAGDGYASVEMELWDTSDRSLVAYSTQQMFFAFAGDVPVGDERFPPDQR